MSANFFVSGIFDINVILMNDELFDDKERVIHVFMKQIFRAAEKAPPPPLPHSTVQGVG
jgi:hypothetical protein